MCNIQSTYATYQCVEQSDCNIPRKNRRRDGIIWSPKTSTSTSISLSSEVWASIICLKPPPCDGAKVFKWQHGHQCRTTPFSQVTVKLLSSSLEPHQTHHIPNVSCVLGIGTLLGKNGASVESRPISPKKSPPPATHSQSRHL